MYASSVQLLEKTAPAHAPAADLARAARPLQHPADRLQSLASNFVKLIEHWACVDLDVRRAHVLALAIISLTKEAPDLVMGLALRTSISSISMRQAFFIAIVAAELGHFLGLSQRQMEVTVKAALMMNIASFLLQDDLAVPWVHPSKGQRIQLARHPTLAAELLVESPHVELGWIEAVEQHHESLDGSGYPHGLSENDICFEARILKLVDIWCALINPRPHRTHKSPPDAFHWLVSRNQQCVDMKVLRALRGMTGNYPPGTLVRLNNRELAVVTRRPHGNAPPRRLVAIINARNKLMFEPIVRDTGQTKYAVRGYAVMPMVNVSWKYWKQVWSLDCSSS